MCVRMQKVISAKKDDQANCTFRPTISEFAQKQHVCTTDSPHTFANRTCFVESCCMRHEQPGRWTKEQFLNMTKPKDVYEGAKVAFVRCVSRLVRT